jgi:hypothetical protein
MKKVPLLMSVSAVVVLLFAPVASAQQYVTASPTATATASPTATALPKSGGSPLVLPLTLAASVALMASGVGALGLLRRRVS